MGRYDGAWGQIFEPRVNLTTLDFHDQGTIWFSGLRGEAGRLQGGALEILDDPPLGAGAVTSKLGGCAPRPTPSGVVRRARTDGDSAFSPARDEK